MPSTIRLHRVLTAKPERVYKAFEPMGVGTRMGLELAREGHAARIDILNALVWMVADEGSGDTPERAERREALRALLALLQPSGA